MVANQLDEIRCQLNSQINDSIQIILKILKQVNKFTMPTIKSFSHISESTTDVCLKWEGGIDVPVEEVKCQVCFMHMVQLIKNNLFLKLRGSEDLVSGKEISVCSRR